MSATATVQRPTRSATNTVSNTFLLFGLAGLLIFGTLAFGAVGPRSRFVLELGGAVLVSAWALAQVFAKRLEIELNPVFWPLLAFGAICLIQIAAHTTGYVFASRSTFQLFVMYCAFAFIASQVLRVRTTASWFVHMATIFGALLAIFAIVQFFTSPDKIYWVRPARFGGNVFGSYVNRNHFSGMMELLLGFPLTLAMGLGSQKPIRVLYGFATVIMITSVVLSGSRGGFVAVSVEALVGLALLFREEGFGKSAIGLLAGIALVVGLVVFLGDSPVFDRIQSIGRVWNSPDSVADVRSQIFKDSVHMWQEKPVLGWGIGTFEATYPSHRTFYTDKNVGYAHNDYLQVLVETGILGFGAILWLIFTIYRQAARNIHMWRLSTRRMLPVAAILGCTGLLIHSFTDFNMEIPANGAWFFVLAAATCVQLPRKIVELQVFTRTQS